MFPSPLGSWSAWSGESLGAEAHLHLLTLLFWWCSLIVLGLRWKSPAFQRLVRYGGRVVGQPVAPLGPAREGPAGQKLPSPTSAFLRAAQAVVTVVARTPLGTVRVRRRTSFMLFYLVGCAAVTVIGLWRHTCGAAAVEQLPLGCFGLHCVWRLVETVRVFHFEEKPVDNVSLFAALSGAVFYVFAALSCDAAAMGTRKTYGTSRSILRPQLVLTACLNTTCLTFLLIQMLQASAHATLAAMRGPTPASNQREDEKEERDAVHTVTEGLRALHAQVPSGCESPVGRVLDEPKLLRYHFPGRTNPLFSYVMEPHYLCEAVLYLINALAVSTVSTVYWTGATAAGRVRMQLRVGCALGVLVFTTLNLSLTAWEHRQFWVRVNQERRRALRALRQFEADTADATLDPEQASVRRLGYVSAYVLRQERLPRWNVFPGVF